MKGINAPSGVSIPWIFQVFFLAAASSSRLTRPLAPKRRKEIVMLQSETLRKAIENLIDAKLVDAMARPDGLNRLLAHRRTGVAAPDIRNAERRLEETLAELLSFSELQAEQAA
jgi:hypothetical protein